MNKKISAILLICLCGMPTVALANAGTPLMWASMIHLVIGNAFIGILEGTLLAKIFSLKKVKTVGIIILANYFSAWLGGLFLGQAIVKHLPIDLNNAWFYFWLMVFITYCITLLLEFPFVVFCLRGDSKWLSKSLWGSLAIQSVSYTIIFGWYWAASGVSLFTQAQVVAPLSISLPRDVDLYFISSTDGNVYRMLINSSTQEKVFELHSVDHNDRLLFRPDSEKRWVLDARLSTSDPKIPKIVKIADFAPQNPTYISSGSEGTWSIFGQVPKLGNANASAWEFKAGFWPIEGLHGTKKSTAEKVHISFETPFVAWNVRNAVHLPTDKVLFQLGDDQICVYDPLKKQVALLARGRGPIVLLK